jgi:hypothetical protein
VQHAELAQQLDSVLVVILLYELVPMRTPHIDRRVRRQALEQLPPRGKEMGIARTEQVRHVPLEAHETMRPECRSPRLAAQEQAFHACVSDGEVAYVRHA